MSLQPNQVGPMTMTPVSTGWSINGGVWIRGNSFDYSDAEGNDRMRLRLHGTDPNPTYIDFTSYSDPHRLDSTLQRSSYAPSRMQAG